MPTLYMAWRGVDDDQNLYWAVSFDGRWWSPELQLSDRASSDAPALAVFQDKLFMAWRGVTQDDTLWWATYDGNANLQWSDQHQLADRGSVEGPALAVFQNKLFMAWRGVSGDQGLYWATYDGNSALQWTSQSRLSGSSFDVPALASFQGQLFIAWRGVEGDEDLYWTTYDGNPDLQGSQLQQNRLSDRGSTEGPALVAFQNKLYMVWKGVQGIDEDDQRLYWATYDANDPRGWTDQNVMEGPAADQSGTVAVGSVHRPALAVFGNDIVVAGAGLSISSIFGLPDTGNSDSLRPGPNPNGPPLPQGPDDGTDQPPPPPPPKGIFYTTFDGNSPTLPITLFTDRASNAPVAQTVYLNIPLSLRNVMLKHGFDPSKGLQQFSSVIDPARMRPVPMRPLVGF
jgi:hypothetical protein